MRNPIATTAFCGLGVISLAATCFAGDKDNPISWKKTVIEGKFRSEGVAVADVNKDGKLDIMIGDSWYEAPSWTKHDIRKPGDFGDGLQQLQQLHDLLDRRRQRRRLGRPDRHRLSRRARPLVRKPQGQSRILARARGLAQRVQ